MPFRRGNDEQTYLSYLRVQGREPLDLRRAGREMIHCGSHDGGGKRCELGGGSSLNIQRMQRRMGLDIIVPDCNVLPR
jgi:hypothetical protein